MKLTFKNATKILFIFITSLTVIFYIFAKGININIFPAEASVNAELTINKGIGFKLSNRFIFFPGNKKVSIESSGFYSQDLEFTVSASSETFSVELKKLPGNIRINLTPEIDTDIFVDGQLKSPLLNIYSIDAGLHNIQIKHPLYITHEANIDILGMGIAQDFSFKLIPNWASITFNSSPQEAGVYLSGNYLGDTPLKTNIVSGPHEVIYKKEGYKDLIAMERVKTGVPRILDSVTLSLLPAIVSIDSTPQKARLIINNNYQGFTPTKINLAPNKKNIISLELDGYKTLQKVINLESNTNLALEFDLEPELGRVNINSNLKADVFVDNVFLGSTPLAVDLHAISQQVSLRKKGYRSYASIIKPSPEFETKVSAFLIVEEAARFRESPDKYTTTGENQMVLLQPGLIEMGAKRSQIGQRANETIRKVELTKPFYLSIHEVTSSQFSMYTKQSPPNNPISQDTLPVVNISWNDAALYCNWLSRKEGFSNFYQVRNNQVIGFNLSSEGYRMPTESEWSWAARTTKSKPGQYLVFPWGNRMPIPKGAGNLADESSKGSSSSFIPNYSDGFPSLAAVGSFNPNDKGIFDLEGNASEYVNDFYSIMIDSKKTYIDLTGPSSGRGHVIKGPSWKTSTITELRYSYRDQSSAGDDKTGFRIARWLIGKHDEI